MLTKSDEALLRRPQVQAITGLSRSTLYDFISKGIFPCPVRLGLRSVAWKQSEVTAWINSRQSTRGAA